MNKIKFWASIICVSIFLLLIEYVYTLILISNQGQEIELYLSEIAKIQAIRIEEYLKSNMDILDNEKIQNILNIDIFQGDGYTHIIDSNGEIIVKSKHPSSNQSISNIFNIKFKDEKSKEQLQKNLYNSRSGVIEIAFFEDNIKKIATYTPIANSNLYIFTIITENVLSYRFKEIIKLTIVFFSLIIISIISLINYIYILKESTKRKLIRLQNEREYKEIEFKDKLEKEVNKAIENNEFKIFIQPKINCKTQSIIGGEALVRWNNEEKGFITPDQFIPLFEKYNIIFKLDMYVLEEICKRQLRWIQDGERKVISVNQSIKNIYKENYIKSIIDIIDKYGIPHNLIELEFTESIFTENVDILTLTIDRLHKESISIAMDDFGSGYSSFNMLKNFNIDVLKLDKEFLKEEANKEKGRLVIESIIIMAKKLNIVTVAEGVETEEQVEFLKKIGCDILQGYYYSKPIEINEYEDKYITKK